jgi:hypothetical protein
MTFVRKCKYITIRVYNLPVLLGARIGQYSDRLKAGHPKNHGSIPGKGKIFFSFPQLPD